LNTGSIGRGGNERGVGDMGPANNTRPILFGYLNICLYICQNLTNMLFAETIKHLREIQSLTQKQLALELGIDVPMYSRIERGERPAKREQVIKLARIFRMDESELLKLWLAEKVYNIVAVEEDASQVLDIVANNIE